MPDVISTMELHNDLVAKWQNTVLYVADTTTARPTQLFDPSTRTPATLPAGWFQLGLVTTDGHQMEKSVDTEDLHADQQLESVRTDLTGSTLTYQVTFMETLNAWAAALYDGIPINLWPQSLRVAYSIPGGAQTYPHMQAILLSQDGADNQAAYKAEYLPDVQVTSPGARTTARNQVDQYQVTFTAYRDSILSAPSIKQVDGPRYALSSGAPAPAPIDATFAADQTEAIADVAPDLPAGGTGAGGGGPVQPPAPTGATAGQPGSFTPAAAIPADLPALKADPTIGDAAWSAATTAAWATTGDYVALGDGSHAYWSGTVWEQGEVA